jgi:hypothetical protein
LNLQYHRLKEKKKQSEGMVLENSLFSCIKLRGRDSSKEGEKVLENDAMSKRKQCHAVSYPRFLSI